MASTHTYVNVNGRTIQTYSSNNVSSNISSNTYTINVERRIPTPNVYAPPPSEDKGKLYKDLIIETCVALCFIIICAKSRETLFDNVVGKLFFVETLLLTIAPFITSGRIKGYPWKNLSISIIFSYLCIVVAIMIKTMSFRSGFICDDDIPRDVCILAISQNWAAFCCACIFMLWCCYYGIMKLAKRR